MDDFGDDLNPAEHMDEETRQIIQELAADELDNAADLNAFKNDLTKSAVQALAQRRRTVRADAARAKVKRKRALTEPEVKEAAKPEKKAKKDASVVKKGKTPAKASGGKASALASGERTPPGSGSDDGGIVFVILSLRNLVPEVVV